MSNQKRLILIEDCCPGKKGTDHLGHEVDDIGDLKEVANIAIDKIKSDNNANLLVFPPYNEKQKWDGGIGDRGRFPPIFEYDEKSHLLTTNTIMGFIGKGNTELFIKSRFDKDDGANNKNYFLHYMLQKVFSLNIVNLDISSGADSILDLLAYLFPSCLRDALSQGLFKQYRRMAYNDSNVKGAIDINRHIRLNIPFAGKVAYTTREHSLDNPVTQLVRHTIEFLRRRPIGHSVLAGDPDIRADVSKIEYATPSYKRGDLRKVISANRQVVNHPYFTKYRPLQKLCLQILRRENVSVGGRDDLRGVLFDGAWLWEEYLNKVFTEQKLGFTHAENKNRKYGIYLFKNPLSYKCYPDFYKENVILDAKYKRLYNIPKVGEKETIAIDSSDMHQIISYMHVRCATTGGFIHPIPATAGINNEKPKTVGTLNGYGGEVKIWSLAIPQSKGTFSHFATEIQKNEEKLKESISPLSPQAQQR